MREYQKILAIKLRELGDTVLWTSALRALRRHFPDARLEVLVPERCAPLLEGHPAVDKIHRLTAPTSSRLLLTLLGLRRERFDLALGFHATTSLCRLARLAGAREWVLHHHSWHVTPKASTHAVPKPGALQDAVLRDRQVLLALGIDGAPLPTSLHVSKEEQGWARAALAGKLPPGKRLENLLVLHPGARGETRRYPRDLWSRLLEALARHPHWTPYVIADAALAEEWQLPTLCKASAVPFFSALSLRQMMALMSLGHAAITNDSGPLHIAAALGLKTVSFWGPSPIGDFHPYSAPDHLALREEVDCRVLGPRDQRDFQYCTVAHCEHHSCLRTITPERVLHEIAAWGPL